MAAQMSAENALRKSETTHNAWKLASEEANKQHAILRRMQLVAATYERDLESAGASSAASRSSSATASQAAANAKQAVNAMRAKAGSSTEAQFAAEEMAAAASAAAFGGGGGSGGSGGSGASGGGLLGAMRDAKDAWRKLAAVTSKFGKPCALPGVEKPKPKVIKPVLEIAAAAPPPKPQKEAPPPASPRVFAVEPGDAGLISTRAFLTPRSSLPLEDTSAEQSSFQARDIGQEMTQNLQEQLAANPASVEDASLFEPPALPQFSKEIPLSLGSFDTSVAADAPKV